MPSLLARVARVRRHEWGVLAEALALAVGVEVALRVWPFAKLVGWVESRPACRPRVSPAEMARLASLSAWPERIPGWPTSCLRRSLVLTAMLRRRHAPAMLCVGVRKDGQGLAAHAWVECEGLSPGRVEAGAFERLTPASSSLVSRSARWSP